MLAIRFSSFFTQGASGFTHTFPEVFNLILKRKESLRALPSPPKAGIRELIRKTQLSFTAPAERRKLLATEGSHKEGQEKARCNTFLCGAETVPEARR